MRDDVIKVLELLNSAVQADPQAMYALLEHRVPCNYNLAEHPNIPVHVEEPHGKPQVGALGLLNGVLAAMGMPKVVAEYVSDGKKRRSHLIRFSIHTAQDLECVGTKEK